MKKLLTTICALMLMTVLPSCSDTQENSSEPSSSISESATEEIVTEPETTAPEETATKATTVETTTGKITEPATEETFESIISETESTEDENNIDINAISDVSVDTDEETITIVLPSNSMIDINSIIPDFQNDDRIIDCILNEDESFTYIITKNGYSGFLNDLSENIEELFNQIVSDDNHPNIIGIEHNFDFTDITINITDEESFSKSSDVWSAIGVATLAEDYQIFDGKEQANCTIHYIDSYGDEVKTSYFPE